MDELRIGRFDTNIIKEHRAILVTGKTGSGKTTLLKYIFFLLRKRFDFACGVAGSSASEEMMLTFLPRSLVYNNLNLSAIERMIFLAKQLKEHGKSRKFLLLLDDCTYDKSFFKNKIFREILMNGRNLQITFVISAQYIMDLQIDLRSQISYVFAFYDPIRANQKRLHEYFFGVIDRFEDFKTIFTENTKNFECLVLDACAGGTNNLSDQLFFFKAPKDIPSFRLGRPIYFMLDRKLSKKEKQNIDTKDLFKQVLNAKGAGSANRKRNGGNVLSGKTAGGRRKLIITRTS